MNNYIFDYLDELITSPICELEYETDYQALISVMLSSQTLDKRVNQVTKVLYKKYDSLKKLSEADIKELEKIIHPLGSYHKKAYNVKEISNRLLIDHNGIVPNDRLYLEGLPGVGRKTTNVTLALVYNAPNMAVDTHVERVSKRLGFADMEDSLIEVENKLYKLIPKEDIIKRNHQLVLFGRYYCKAINPLCESCKLKEICKKNK